MVLLGNSVATALADGIAEIHVQGLTGNLNTTVLTGGFYPNAVTLGAPIQFQVSAPVAATAPAAPTGVVAVGGDTQAVVTFAAPANGGSPITGYTVTSSPAGGVDSNAGTTGLTHTITGLSNGTSYTFTVVATNAVGNSAASAASNAVTPAVAVGQVVSIAASWALGGANDWNGATSSLVTTQPVGGGQANAAMVVIAPASRFFGTTFLTLANQEFCTTANPTISIEVYAPVAGKVVRLKLEQDGAPANNIEMDATTVLGWQTLSYNCLTSSGNATTPPTAPYVEGTVYNKASILFNFDTVAANPGETWYFDSVTYTPTAAVTYVPPAVLAAPTVAATAPAHAIVLSVLTAPGADIVGTNFFPAWGQATKYAASTIGGVETAVYSSLNYEGIQLAAVQNVSAATNVHFDVWTDVTSLGFTLIQSAAAGGVAQFQVNSTLTPGVWNAVDIPLSSFIGVPLTSIDQLSFTGVTPAAGGTIYIQNLYFW